MISSIRRRLRFLVLAAASLAAAVVAVILRAPGQRFGWAGRWFGLRAMLARQKVGRDLVLTPVHIVRYWEFPFTLRHVPRDAKDCLDVGSPRLFPLYLANRRRELRVRVINPDHADTATTAALARVLGRANVEAEAISVADLGHEDARYDAIWSISVIEHIHDDADGDAMALLYGLLRPGGRLIVTVPVDRRAWDEYRERDTYNLGLPRGPQGYFFQRWYDEAAIRTRLLASVGGANDGSAGSAQASISTAWFGERQPGRFARYEQDWMRRGHRRSVWDPIEIARGYRTYASWAEMPGQGVCGIAITKPRS